MGRGGEESGKKGMEKNRRRAAGVGGRRVVERANRVPNAEKPEPQAIGARHQQAARRKVLWK